MLKSILPKDTFKPKSILKNKKKNQQQHRANSNKQHRANINSVQSSFNKDEKKPIQHEKNVSTSSSPRLNRPTKSKNNPCDDGIHNKRPSTNTIDSNNNNKKDSRPEKSSSSNGTEKKHQNSRSNGIHNNKHLRTNTIGSINNNKTEALPEKTVSSSSNGTGNNYQNSRNNGIPNNKHLRTNTICNINNKTEALPKRKISSISNGNKKLRQNSCNSGVQNSKHLTTTNNNETIGNNNNKTEALPKRKFSSISTGNKKLRQNSCNNGVQNSKHLTTTTITNGIIKSNDKKQKKEKAINPFRVKPGSIVIIRHKCTSIKDVFITRNNDVVDKNTNTHTTTNHDDKKKKTLVTPSNNNKKIIKKLTTKFSQNNRMVINDDTSNVSSSETTSTWMKPDPTRDDGYMLIGKMIRFPILFLIISPSQVVVSNHNNSNDNADILIDQNDNSTLIVGEIVSILQQQQQHCNEIIEEDGIGSSSSNSIMVEALLDNTVVEQYHLQKYILDNTAIDDKKKKERNGMFEEIIKGINKSKVRLNLPSAWNCKFLNGIGTFWEIFKHVTTSSNQINGEVIDIIADPKAFALKTAITNDSSSTTQPSRTLATVHLKRLWLPEQTNNGRLLSHHKLNEVFDHKQQDDDDDECNYNNISQLHYWKVNIEDLIVISKRLVRIKVMEDEILRKYDFHNENTMFASYSYCSIQNKFIPFITCKQNGTKQKQLQVSKIQELQKTGTGTKSRGCHRCRRVIQPITKCTVSTCNTNLKQIRKKWWCVSCCQYLQVPYPNGNSRNDNWIGPCCQGKCDCDTCQDYSLLYQRSIEDKLRTAIMNTATSCKQNQDATTTATNEQQHQLVSSNKEKEEDNIIDCSATSSTTSYNHSDIYKNLSNVIESSNTIIDFDLPSDYYFHQIDVKKSATTTTAAADHTSRKLRERQSDDHNIDNNTRQTPKINDTNSVKIVTEGDADTKNYDWENNIIMSCARCNDHSFTKDDIATASAHNNDSSITHSPLREDFNLNLRYSFTSTTNKNNKSENLNTQQKDPPSSTSYLDTEIIRCTSASKVLGTNNNTAIATTTISKIKEEQYLQFGKSPIHQWGVFATKQLYKNEMIIEYKGEIISHTQADLREINYRAYKICDYMFRIDCQSVCDATKCGSLARFINASCDPNCYTEIVESSSSSTTTTTATNSKHIIIFAQRDIAIGEELCYDYKFPIEYDSTKLIKCYCRAKSCRGYMNR